jgi:multiple sugar transport system substrate-binding protein
MGSSAKRVAATCLAALLGAVALTSCGDDESGPPTLNFYTFTAGAPKVFETSTARCNKQANGRYKIKIQELPPNADDQRQQLARRLAAEDDQIDIMALDVIFTAEFAEAGWAKEWTGESKRIAEEGTIETTLATARNDGKLYAAPFTSNTQVLWYRKDRVKEPPKTWNEMIDQAEKLPGGPQKNQIQVQGKQAEGYTVWFIAMLLSAGGEIPTDAGEDVQLGDPAVRSLEVMKRVATSPTAPPALANNGEDEGRLAFQQGDSTFMVNYPFVYPSAKEEAPDVFKNMGIAPYPGVEDGQPAKVTLGGINLGVSNFSDNPDLAFEAAMCLRGEENQIINTQKGGLPPTIESLYDNKEIKKAYPGFADLMKQGIEDGTPRPVTPAYSDISLTIQQTLHPPGGIDPNEALDQLRDRIDVVKDGGIY